VIRKGMIWRVGDFCNLNIWRDPWLPRGISRRPITPRGTCLLSQVAELINPVTGEWDVQLVKEVFWEEDSAVILALPVHEGRDNVIACNFDNHGRFSVRSAYKVCRDDIMRERSCSGAQGSSSDEPDPIWKMIWQIKAPSKVKHFLWRVCHNSHPLRSNLVQRGMKIVDRCLISETTGEDGGHLFFKCRLAMEV
jgi:hypothetical protein